MAVNPDDVLAGMEEAPDQEPQEGKMVIKDGEVIEDFVQALNFEEPTEEQNPTDVKPQAHEGIVGNDFFDPQGEWAATALGETPDGKTVQVKKREDGAGYRICYREGLSKPEGVDGWFTNFEKAEHAGRVFLNRKWDEARASAANA